VVACYRGNHPGKSLPIVRSPLNYAILGIAAYVLAQLAIGAYVSRRIRTEEDYLVAGRSLGPFLATFTIFATWFGAETCIGAAAVIYETGIEGIPAEPFGYGLCLILMGALFAIPLWRRKLTTLGDLYRQRYGVSVERLAVLIMVPASLLWAAAQIRAFGQIVALTTGLDVALTITIAALVVITYTIFGGLLADAYTDLIQGSVLIIGLVVLLVFVWQSEVVDFAVAFSPERVNFRAMAETPVLELIERWSIPVVGSVLAAELVARVIAVKSPGTAQRSALSAGGIYLVLGLIPLFIGMVGFAVFPEMADPEQILPAMAAEFLPPVLFTVFIGALISAILSTVDSALLVASGLVSHNIIVPQFPKLPERGKVMIARGGVALFGMIAFVLAMSAEGVYDLVLEASAFGSSGLVIVGIIGLFSTWGGRLSALAALAAGVISWVGGAYLIGLPYPYVTSLVAASVSYAAVAVFEKRGNSGW
jgi:SSS family transporter